MPPITGFSGLVAGFDTAGAVDELLGARKFEISQLQKTQDAETAKQAAFAELSSLVASFKNQSLAMSDQDKFLSYTATLNSSDAAVPASNLVDVAGDNSVRAGNHSITVQQLATTARSSSSTAVKDSFGTAALDGNTALNFASSSFQVNGININVGAADSLNDIANAINTASTGVTASVIKVADADFRLVLAADDTGAAGFTLTGADLDAAGVLANLQIGATGQANAIKTLQVAQDAKVNIDGLTVIRSSNSIGDAIAGLTFTLKQADPATTVNMAIGIDSVDVRSQVQAFVDSYNAVVSFIDGQYTVDAETGDNGVLAGETLLTSLKSNLTSGLLRSVPGLASDRDSLVRIGVEPDQFGVLNINDDLFSTFLNNDPAAIRDLFVAQGSTTTSGMQFLVAGDNTLSGSYAVNIDQIATRASLTGSINNVNTPLPANQTVTFTEAGNARQAIVDLLAGDVQADIVSKMNTEFARVATETRVFDQTLIDSATTLAATGSTTFANLGANTGDTITIVGTNRSGLAINNTFTILDKNQDTISDLLFSIQSAFNQQVTASVDASGRIQIQDGTVGDSQLSVSLTSSGVLNFGVDTTAASTEGRYAMSLEAIADGNLVTIQHTNFGAGNGFSIAGASTGIGIADSGATPTLGTSISGTINGESTTGSGQVLVGNNGGADGIGLLYQGNATPPFTANVVIGMGAAASFNGTMDLYSNPFSGFFQSSVATSEQTYLTIADRITSLELQMDKQRVSLTRSFLQMEQAMNSLNSTGSFLTQQVDAFNRA
ncbi:MAG: flagellar filament capping protein FliD [Ghiorsea sp.]